MLPSTSHQLYLALVQHLRVEVQFLGLVMQLLADHVDIVILVSNEHGVLANSEVFDTMSHLLIINHIHLSWHGLRLNHVYADSWVNAKLTTVILTPGVKLPVAHKNGSHFIG